MFPTFREHAAPRAALMFTSGPSHGEAIGTYQGEPLYHASLDGAEYRVLLDEHGFEVVTHVVEDPTCGHHTVWLARLRQGLSGRSRRAMAEPQPGNSGHGATAPREENGRPGP